MPQALAQAHALQHLGSGLAGIAPLGQLRGSITFSSAVRLPMS